MEYKLEVVTLSIRDIDEALAFYTEMLGFTLDVDYHPRDDFRVVQLTPPGSACSIQFGTGLTDALPGSARASCLVVSDIEPPTPNLSRAVSKSAISGTNHRSTSGQASSRPAQTPPAGTTRAWPTSPTPTATPGYSRKSATSHRGHG